MAAVAGPVMVKDMTGVARMGDWSAGDVGGLFAGVVSLLGSLGFAARYLFGRADKAHTAEAQRLAAWRASLDNRERNERLSREKRLSKLEERTGVLERVAADQREVLIKVTVELEHHNPLSAALAEARLQLAKHYPGFYEPVEGNLPADQADIIDQWRSTP